MKNKRNMSPDAAIPFYEQLGYLAGASSVGTYSIFFGTFILVYYTNVMHIDPGIAASIIAMSRIFDGISDLVMGRVIDNTKSKYGKSRPWYLRVIIPSIICALLVFWQPAGLNGTMQIIYVFLTYNLAVTVCNTAMAVPDFSYVSYATMNAKSRSFLGGIHMLGVNVIVPLVVTSNFLKISEAFGGGDAYTQAGFLKTIIVFLILYAVLSLICFLVIRERVSDIKESGDSAQEKIPVKKTVKSLITNKYWLICTGITLLVYILMGATSGTTVYYAQYVAGNLDLQASITQLYTVTMLAALIITLVFIVGRIGKRNTIIIGSAIAAIGYALPLLANSPMALHIGGVLRGIGFGISSVPTGSILQDSLTYGLWKDGFSAVGMGNAAGSFANKLGNAFGTVALGWALQWGGFVSTASVQAAGAQSAITFMYATFPAILCAGMVVLAFIYDLDGEKYTRIEQDIKSGNFGSKRKQ
ncbi:MFS transporter [Faecalicatena orotica]|uniref:GPH family glycoside/pentoside/hexuronide:cation symporter n=1 Tax=Faecalicatena orotica TaxID=1544 RepID=A0A2Y9BB34_9FIRM|nr:MFS transporter [Faecalicatena orotica]PWJ30684.1 GPH family glycoside/pentoside/hexuronide:cation symporter [Faecalicatena orotica]SSA54845.1 glycoside/pentoside/hexuronide:cation symporter, GPH family [Faecalicatena orotica]